MKKRLEKRNIRSGNNRANVIFDHPAQSPINDEQTDPSETRITQLIAYVDKIEQAPTDGYWSVLREEL